MTTPSPPSTPRGAPRGSQDARPSSATSSSPRPPQSSAFTSAQPTPPPAPPPASFSVGNPMHAGTASAAEDEAAHPALANDARTPRPRRYRMLPPTWEMQSVVRVLASLNRPQFRSVLIYCFLTLWVNADINLLAPNLTQVQQYFNMTSDERDLLLGGYVPLVFYLVASVSSIVFGALGDTGNRTRLLFFVIVLGEVGCLATLAVETYAGLLVTRAVVGASVGGAQPLVMSLVSDQYGTKHRGQALAIISIFIVGGTLMGQLISSAVGPTSGWKWPFLVVAVPPLVVVPLLFCVVEPWRGQADVATESRAKGGPSSPVAPSESRAATTNASPLSSRDATSQKPAQDAPKYEAVFSWNAVRTLLTTRTAALYCALTVFSTAPWGVALSFAQDWLANERGLSVESTSLVLVGFGLGGAIGTVAGGLAVDLIWKREVTFVPVLLGSAILLALAPYFVFVDAPLGTVTAFAGVAFLVALPAMVAQGGGSQALLLNVTMPESRSFASAVFTVAQNIGFGVGPVVYAYIANATGSRTTAFNWLTICWFLVAILYAATLPFVRTDAQRVLEAVRKAAVMDLLHSDNQEGLVAVAVAAEVAEGGAKPG